MSYLTQFDISGVLTPITLLTGDVGGAIAPVAGNINLLGGNVLTTTGVGNTITFDLDNGTNGQVLIGGGADPAWATITSADATVTFAVGANTLDLSVVAVALDFVTDVGTATEAADTIDILGGTGINTAGAAAVVTINLDIPVLVANGGTGLTTITDGGVMVGSGAGAITPLTVGTNGQVLLGSTAADPVFATLTSTGSTIDFTLGAGTLNLETNGAVSTSFPTDSGTATPAAGVLTVAGGTNITTSGAGSTVTINLDAAITLATSVTSPLYTVASGDLVLNMADDAGTDAVSFTNDSDAEVAYIDSLGAASFTELDVDNINIDGNTIISTDTDGDITLTPDGSGNVNISYLTQYTLPITGASGAIGDLADGLGSNLQMLTSNGVGSEPTWEDAAVIFTWAVTTVNASIVVNNGYIADKVGLLTMTLPASGAIGDIIELTNINTAVGWRIAQNALQAIRFGSLLTTIGVGGYLEATVLGDSVRLVCTVSGTSTRWLVLSVIGNITIV